MAGMIAPGSMGTTGAAGPDPFESSRKLLPRQPYLERTYDPGTRTNSTRTVDPGMDRFKQIMALMPAGTDWSKYAGDFTGAGGAGAAPAPIAAPIAASTAGDLGFARAKERVGLTARGALGSLRNEMQRRGITGSSVETGRTGQILAGAGRTLSDADLAAALADISRTDAAASAGYQGAITQRGQDISANQGRLGALMEYLRLQQTDPRTQFLTSAAGQMVY